MRVVIANPGEVAQVAEIDPGLEAKQAVVDGLVELWAVDGHVNFLCNDEGRINSMPFNRYVTLSDGSVWDIFGPILVVGADEEEGTFESLTEDEARHWVNQLNSAMGVSIH